MREFPLGWATDLAVLEHTGSVVEDHGDHLVVRSPASPDFHWGNCLVVTDAGAVDDAARWVAAFRAAFPVAGWVAVGLPRLPATVRAWADLGLVLELDDVLATHTLPPLAPPPPGYAVRRIDGDDWEQVVALAVEENDRTGEQDPDGYRRFCRDQARVRRSLCDRGVAAFFGAFAGDALAADLGVVRCGSTARYQDVGTGAAHRRRGLAAHLLGVAARWAADQGCHRWVIVTGATNPAGRVYRRLGFRTDAATVQAYRPPPRTTRPGGQL